MPTDQFNFMHNFMTTPDGLNKALLEIWRDNKMEEKHNFPKTVKEYIEQNSYASSLVSHSDKFRGSRVMDTRDVHEMISHYFNTAKPSEDLSAEDFVKAIDINLDMLIAGFADKEGDATSDLTKMMLEYTKKFINEFVETAVVKTDDEKEESDQYLNVIPKDLVDTAPYMTSDQYQLRFIAEYYQLKIRIDKLQNMVDKWDKGELYFTPTCPRSTYDLQIRAMRDYLTVLEMRAIAENIVLEYRGLI